MGAHMTNDSQPADMDSLKQAAMAEWEAKWEAVDFSWEGLADAGWELDDQASEAQKLKRWRAPAHYPGGGAVRVVGADTWREASLQDYWRWSIGITDDNPSRLLSDEELLQKGLIERDTNGKLWHVLHTLGDVDANLRPLIVALTSRLAIHSPANKQSEKHLLLIGGRVRNLGLLLQSICGVQILSLDASYAKIETCGWSEVMFGDCTNFDHAVFTGNTQFNRCRFGKSTSFRGAVFQKSVSFHEATFEDRASFVRAQFHDKVTFDGTEFKGAVFFGKSKFPSSPMNSVNAFRATRFRELAGFDNIDIHYFAAFNEARFYNGVMLRSPSDSKSEELWYRGLKPDHLVPDGHEAYFAALEGGCRVLKQEMEKIADRSREQRYFRYELIARRHRPDINLMEKWVSHIYGLTSDYGHSIGRPLLYMGGLFLMMLLCVFLIAVCGAGTLGFGLFAPPHPALVDSFALAWQNIVKPGAVWDVRFPLSVPALTDASNGPGLPIWLKVLASVHSALSFIFLFLAGVAIRRKFRIG